LARRAIPRPLYPPPRTASLSTATTSPQARGASAPAARRARRWAAGLLGAIGVVLGVATVAFFLLFALRRSLFPPEPSGLEQYRVFMERAFLHFDFGRASSASDRPVAELMRLGLPVDLALMAGGIVAGLVLGAAGGLVLSLRPGRPVARAIELLAMLAISTPVYVVGLELLLVFGAGIGSAGLGVGIPIRYAPFAEGAIDWAASMAAPWIVLGLPLAGLCVRITAVGAADVFAQDFIRAARARGVPGRRIAVRHVLPVAASPALAIASTSSGLMLTNMVLVEKAFSIPGFMQLVPRSVGQADVATLLGLSVAGAVLVVMTTAVLQAVVDRLDPRARRR
jgi:peptide/nickel transport system permease protein